MEIRPILSSLRRHKTAGALIVLQVALTCAIVCNALFLITERLDSVSLSSGIAEQELLQIRMSGLGQGDNADARTREDLVALRAIPGVVGVTLTNQLPFSASSSNSGLALAPDQEHPTLNATTYRAYDGMVETLGIRLSAGRDFRPDEYVDITEMEAVTDYSTLSSPAIISAEVAERMFPGDSALGKTIYLGPIPLTVIGVADTLTRPNGSNGGNMTYSFILPLRHNYNNGGFYMLRVADPERRGEVLEAAVAVLEKIDPNRLILNQRSYSEMREEFFSSDREMIGLLLVVCLALLAVTAFGIVGLASFWVQQRTRQIGVRRALGATKGQILRYFQTENFLLATLGIVLGMLGAYGINQWLMATQEMARLPLYYLPVGALVLWLLGQVAVFGPARRAASVPPAIATRSA